MCALVDYDGASAWCMVHCLNGWAERLTHFRSFFIIYSSFFHLFNYVHPFIHLLLYLRLFMNGPFPHTYVKVSSAYIYLYIHQFIHFTYRIMCTYNSSFLHRIIDLFKTYKLQYIAPLDEMRDTNRSYNSNFYAHQSISCTIVHLIT